MPQMKIVGTCDSLVKKMKKLSQKKHRGFIDSLEFYDYGNESELIVTFKTTRELNAGSKIEPR